MPLTPQQLRDLHYPQFAEEVQAVVAEIDAALSDACQKISRWQGGLRIVKPQGYRGSVAQAVKAIYRRAGWEVEQSSWRARSAEGPQYLSFTERATEEGEKEL